MLQNRLRVEVRRDKSLEEFNANLYELCQCQSLSVKVVKISMLVIQTCLPTQVCSVIIEIKNSSYVGHFRDCIYCCYLTETFHPDIAILFTASEFLHEVYLCFFTFFCV